MSEPSTTPPEPQDGPRQRASYASPGMRISDAERAEVADRLSTHYSDGRLDEAEFGRRLDQAMHAVTQGDLGGLFDDLPDDSPAGAGAQDAGPGSRRPGLSGAGSRGGAASPRRGGACSGRRPPLHRIAGLAIFVLIALVVGHALTHLFIPWLVIGVVAFLWLRRGTGRRSRGRPAGG